VRLVIMLLLVAAAAGCLEPYRYEPAGASEPVRREPVEVYKDTIDFTSGEPGSVPIAMPEGARHFTLTGRWSENLVGASDASFGLVDGSGAAVASCELRTAVVSSSNECGPKTNMADNGPYTLSWEGRGTVSAEILIMAQFPQE
jgi:hypothetical protein